MKFTPVKFQGSLAAAGITLMPFNFLKTTIYNGESVVALSKLNSLSLSSLEHNLAIFLSVLMFAFILIHLALTVVFLKELLVWLFKTKEYKNILSNPLTNSTLFSPLISIPMTLIVLFGPASFFVPQISANMQSFMLPSLILFTFLWVVLIGLKMTVVKILVTKEFESAEMNFSWLLDILAFGALSLLGSSIANASNNDTIATIAVCLTSVLLLIGLLDFGFKLVVLIYQQIKLKNMPALGMLPAYFLIIPPTCLLWYSFYNVLSYVGITYSIDVSIVSFLVIVFAYTSTVVTWILLIAILNSYFKNKFLTCDFSPAQWGIV